MYTQDSANQAYPGAATSGTLSPTPISTIEDAVMNLTEKVLQYIELSNALRSRLTPLLSQNPSSANKDSAAKEPQTDTLSNKLRAITSMIKQENKNLDDVLQRLEI